MKDLYNYYIKIDSEGWIIDAYSDALRLVDLNTDMGTSTDILIGSGNNLNYVIYNIANAPLQNENFQLLYKYDSNTKQIIQSEKPLTYEYLKNKLIEGIDQKTGDMFALGFDFDNNTFSLSVEAQSNWTNLSLLYAKGYYPKEGILIATKKDKPYLLSLEKANDFFTQSFSVGQYYYSSGLIEKNKIYSMTTVEQLLNYTDSRGLV